jgi:hypothetical protein
MTAQPLKHDARDPYCDKCCFDALAQEQRPSRIAAR